MDGGIYTGEAFKQEGQMMRGIDHRRRRAYLETVYGAVCIGEDASTPGAETESHIRLVAELDESE